MNERRHLLTDAALRAALTREPSTESADQLFHALSIAIDRTPQRRVGRFAALWSSWPVGADRSPGQRDVRMVAVMVGLLVALLAGLVVGLVGQIHRLPEPFGLARPGLVAFDSGGHIFVASPDGRDVRQLTSGDATDIQPTWSPNGTRIAYQSLDRASKTVRLILMDPDGRAADVVGTAPAISGLSGSGIGWFRVAWSPDSRRLAYTALVAGASQVMIVDADGGNLRPVGDPALEGQDPTWSPNGTEIAFRGGRFEDDIGIYAMHPDGSSIRRLTPQGGVAGPTDYRVPVWSPRGDLIAYTRTLASGRSHVFLVGAAGGPERDVSAGPDDAWAPAWSPDGRLAWLRSPPFDEHGRFVVDRLDGSDPVALGPTVTSAPTWSPDGRRLMGLVWGLEGVSDHVVLIDLADGTYVDVPASPEPGAQASWQRLAP
jgi:WD40 repeat protein